MSSTETFEKAVEKIKSKHDDDFVDRLNYMYTAFILAFFAIIVFAKQLFGTAIECFYPPEFTRSWERYSVDYCFAQNTYFVNMTEYFPPKEERSARELHYYQYVPFILAVQFLFFVMPKFLRSATNIKTGLVVHKFTSVEDLDENMVKEKGKEFLKIMMKQKNGLSGMRANPVAKIKTFLFKTPITRIYLMFKFLNTLNAIVQLILINHYMSPFETSGMWGFEFLRALSDTKLWRHTGHFPRVVFCDFSIKEIAAKPIPYTLQCVLVINLLNEKIFIFFWFWLSFMAVLNTFNLFQWIYATQVESQRIDFIADNLPFGDRYLKELHMYEFVSTYLLIDGVTALRIAQINSGELATSLMVESMWEDFLVDRGYKKREVLKAKVPDEIDAASKFLDDYDTYMEC